MPQLEAVDRVEALVIVDNLTDSLSSNPAGVRTEFAGFLSRGPIRPLAGRNLCCAHHGLSVLITTHRGSQRHSVLFDAGPEGATFLRNANLLGVDLGSIDAVVLSHGHWDHAGGLVEAIEAIAARRPSGRVECYVHPGMFAQRAARRPDGTILEHDPMPDPQALAQAGADVINTREPRSMAGATCYVSGEIPRVTAFETGLPRALRRSADGQSWESDELIMDERFVSVHVKGKGQFVFSACSHAGIINVLTHAREVFPSIALHGTMGGFHLSGSTEAIIPQTVAGLTGFGLKLLAPGHCTGWRALSVMARTFGEELVPTAVGKHYVI